MLIPLLEGVRGAIPFIADRTKPFLTETRNGKTFTCIPGRFSLCDSVNGNNRRYPKKVWEKNLAEGSLLRQSIAKNSAFGLLEHPSNGQISLLSPICIAITEAKLQPSTDPTTGKTIYEVVGSLTVLNTAEGQKLSALIEFGYNPLVSSRGFGSVVKGSDNVDEVQEDYICEGWDVVKQPSFETAEIWPDQASQVGPGRQAEAAKAVEAPKEAVLAEDKAPTAPVAKAVEEAAKVPEPNLKAASPPPIPEAAPAAASAKQNLTEKVMTINEIKSRIGVFAATKVPSEPARFAEGLNEMAQIHQEIANFVAEDGKRSWQGQQLHDELKALERTWSESALAPAKQASRVTENYRKVLRVTKVLGEAAISIRKKLSEAITQNTEATQLVEDLTERGQAWVAYANKLKARLTEAERRLDVACEALDIIKDRYNEDVTDLGKRVITLEFAEKAQVEDIQKALKEATRPAHVIAIREKLDPKVEGKKPEAKKDESKKDQSTTPAAPVQENKKDSEPPKAPEGSALVVEARVLVPSVRSITESVEMSRRLSAASAK